VEAEAEPRADVNRIETPCKSTFHPLHLMLCANTEFLKPVSVNSEDRHAIMNEMLREVLGSECSFNGRVHWCS
jgi:hypothetical protein